MDFRAIFSLFFAVLLLSCSGNDDKPEDEAPFFGDSYPQEWKLFKMTGSMKGYETTGDEIEWQETYTFHSNKTFTKTRVRDDETISGTGTFSISQNENGEWLSLTYEDEDNPIIATCSGDHKEQLNLDPEGGILISAWQQCDGPGLFYELAE